MSVYYNQRQKAPELGRQMGQLANPFQQNEGEDKNVEQQAVSQALRGPSRPKPAEQVQQQQAPSGNLSAPGMIPVFAGMMPQNTGVAGNMTQVQQARGQGITTPEPGQEPPGSSPNVTPAGATPQTTGGAARPTNLANPFLLGFDTDKLYDPNSGSVAGSKYTNDAKIFGQLYLEGTPIGRNNLDPMVQAMRGRGLAQATAVGDDKIDPDGPGPQPPIDVIRGGDDGIVYQNTTGNPVWEQQFRGGGGVHGAALSQALSTAPGHSNDPFAAIGGGVQLPGGEWVPRSHPLAEQAIQQQPQAAAHHQAAPAPAQPAAAAPVATTRHQPAAPAPAQNPADPFASIGGGVQLANGAWVPKDHPLAQAGPQAPAAPAAPQAPGAPAATSAFGAGPTSFRSVPQRPAETIYNPGDLPEDTSKDYSQFQFGDYSAGPYDQFTFDQFLAPNQSGIESQQQQILQRILSNPHTMSAQNVAQLKEMNKEEALEMERQLGDRLSSNLAGRGLAGGGMENASRRRMGEEAIQQILTGNRAVDLEKMARDRGDELSALGAADDVLGNQMSRSTQGYGARLAGQNAQAGEGRFGYQAKADDADRKMQRDQLQAGEGQFGFQAGMDRAKFALQRALAGEEMKQAGADSAFRSYSQDANNYFNQGDLDYRNRSLDVQRDLGQGGLDIDRSRITEGGRQFDLSHQLALQEFAERMRQFNGQMGYQYNALTQNGQNEMIRQILAGL